MFTKEELDKWRSEGFPFDNFYDSIAQEKKPEDESKKYSIKGFWSSDPQGGKIIGHATLSNTVYYNIRTTGIPNGKTVTLKLFEDDGMLLKPDEKFNGKELTKTVKISDGKASFSLTLDDNWEKNIKKDVGFEIELYWVAYQPEYFFYGEKLGSILNVSRSNRFLFFKPPTKTYNLPELLTFSGEVIVYGIGDALEIPDAEEQLDDCKFFVGARILKNKEKFKNVEQISQRNKDVYNLNIYNNKTKMTEITGASNFGYLNEYVRKGKPTTGSDKEILNFFSNKAVLKNVRKLSKGLLTYWDLEDLLNIMFTNDSHNVPIPGPWGWASEMLTNYVFKPELEKVIQDLRNEAISKFQITKQYGLEASILFLQSPAGDIGKYRSYRVSTPILKKLLKGDFLTMKDVISSDHYPDQINTIIYQVFDEGFSGEEYAVIDCIFVGDNLLK